MQGLSKRENTVCNQANSKPKPFTAIIMIATTSPGQAVDISQKTAQFVKKRYPNSTVTTLTGPSKELLGGVISCQQKALPENKRNTRR